MNRTPIHTDIEQFPAAFHALLADAAIYDSSSSKAARVFFIDKDKGYFLKSAPKGALETEAELTRFFHKKQLSAEVLSYLSSENDWLLTEPRKAEISSRVFERRELPEFDAPVERVSWQDGCKLCFADGSWLILRFSGTEPRVRVFAEAETVERARALVGVMAEFLKLPFGFTE